MRNDDEKTQMMVSECLGEERRRGRNTAANLLVDGRCEACSSEEQIGCNEVIQCYWCKDSFHAINCIDDSCNVSAPTAFTNHLSPAVNNTSPYDKRFGRFLFTCNDCVTYEEKRRAAAASDRVELLDIKIDSFKREFKEELGELKQLLKAQLTPNKVALKEVELERSESPPVSDNQSNDILWSQRVENLKHLVTLKKKTQSDGTPMSPELLEKTCADSGASVVKTFSLGVSNDTAVVCNSRKDAEKLIGKIEDTLPGHDAELVAARKPEINIVGLVRKYDKEDLKDFLIKQNPEIANLYENKATALDDKHISVLSVTPLKSYKGTEPSLYKATVRISNLIREMIHSQGDRVYIGSNSLKVYSSFYIPRCYNCQKFGHISEKCNQKDNPTCGFCAEKHDTKSCTKKNDNKNTPTCINCQSSETHKSMANHFAGSFNCPILQAKQKQLKKRIPFHQKHP